METDQEMQPDNEVTAQVQHEQVAPVEDDSDFIDMNDAVEVAVDDDDAPMEEDDVDDDEVGDAAAVEATDSAALPDMSKFKLESHSDHVYAVAAHLDPSSMTLSILSGGGDDKSFLHQVPANGTVSSTHLSHAHTDSVACVAFNLHCSLTEDVKKTPPLAAVGGYDGAIILYHPFSGEKVLELEGPSDVEWICFHPKGGSVLLAGSVADGTVWMYHIPTKKCMQVFVGHESGVTSGSFSQDGKWVLSASQDGTLRIFAPRTGICKHIFRTGEAGLTCMAIGGGSDGQLVMVGAEDGVVHICHIGTKKEVATLRHFEPPVSFNESEDEDIQLPMSVEAVGFSPSNPSWCASGGVDGVLKIWDLSNGQCRQSCKQSGEDTKAGITRLTWHPTLPLVLTAATDGVLRLWDTRNGLLLDHASGHDGVVNDMDVTWIEPRNNGGRAVVVAGSDDNTVRVFEIDIAAVLSASSTSHKELP